MPHKNGPLTKWPSDAPSLGMYVVPRNLRLAGRDKGTWRILFEVPARLRPSGWPATIHLPRDRPYCTGHTDIRALVRIQDEATALLEELRNKRAGGAPAVPEEKRGSIPWLIVQMGGPVLLASVRGDIETMRAALNPGVEGTDEWLDQEASTRAGHIRLLRFILALSEENQHAHIQTLDIETLTKFLNIWREKRTQRTNIRALLVSLWSIALTCGEITDNTPAKIVFKKRKRQKGGRRTRVQTWERRVAYGYAEVARTTPAWRNGRGSREAGPWGGGSILVQLMYETAADSTDVITWFKGKGGHFVDDANLPGINFSRGKTDEPTFVPISQGLAAEIRANGSNYLVTTPFGGRNYRPTIDDAMLRSHMRVLRKYAEAAGYPRRIYDHLRHTAATEAVEGGVDIENVKDLTAHADSSMVRSIYVQRRKEETIKIQRARGIIT